MRQADEPEISVEVTVHTEPAPVWALVTDIDLPARFSGEFQGAHWLDGVDRPAVGARFVGRNRRLFGTEPVEWETTSTVTALEPERASSGAWATWTSPSPGGVSTSNPEGRAPRS